MQSFTPPTFLDDDAQEIVRFNPTWTAIGPFQIGTREAIWGSDPLAAHGGFSSLKFDSNATFASSLSPNGLVGWTEHHYEPASSQSGVLIALDLSFPSIDWPSLKSCYGWAAVQFQVWARGSFVLDAVSSRRVVIYCDQIFELIIDGQPYFGGDLFTFRRAPIVVELAPGQHVVELRLIRDARAMGAATENPSIQTSLEIRAPSTDMLVEQAHNNIPDLIDGRFCSLYASISLTNLLDEAVKILDVKYLDDDLVRMRDVAPNLLPGQSRPIALLLAAHAVTAKALTLVITYQLVKKSMFFTMETNISLRSRDKDEPHRFTFAHPSGTVSYAIICPPLQYTDNMDANLPIVVNLHGAGLEADSQQLRHSLDDVRHLPAWFIFPSGTTSWSGDDWHEWGWRDVEAAILAIPSWCIHNAWKGAGPNTERLLMIGHSNGGQGTLYALSHWPDRIIAAAVAAGYMSVQSYVPFQLWREMDPLRMSVILAAMNSFRHELLAPNLKGIPIYAQHGSEDDNVPPFHSRRFHQLLQEHSVPATYSEIEARGHWWTGALVTAGLQKFYQECLEKPVGIDNLQEFSFIIASPADTGSKNGLRIELLQMPGQLGKVDLIRTKNGFDLRTSNVHQLSFPKTWLSKHEITVDRERLGWAFDDTKDELVQVTRDSLGTWTLNTGQESSDTHASARHLGGGLHAILRTPGILTILAHDAATREIALRVAQNLYQYLAADVTIVSNGEDIPDRAGNIITFALGDNPDPGIFPNHPIGIQDGNVIVRKHGSPAVIYSRDTNGLGVIYLRPWTKGRLELVVWGQDRKALQHASRFVPMMSGGGQPDFIVQTADCLWKGADGTLALGFFDHRWNITPASYLT